MSANASAGAAEPTPAPVVPESVAASDKATTGVSDAAGTGGKATTKGASNGTGKGQLQETGGSSSVVETVKRFIPGLKSKDDQQTLKSKRSRGSKAGKKTGTTTTAGQDVAAAGDPALATAILETAPSRNELPAELQATGKPRPAGLNGTAVHADSEADQKRFSAVGNIQKRLRANNKKLQKLQAYEAQTTPLNADQKKSLEQKPVLEAIQRELTDVSKSLEAEEAEEEKRAARRKQGDDAQVQQKIAAAVQNQKLSSQNDLSLLLQFLHLYSLFNSSQGQYANATIPPVVTNATPQQHAAVHALFYNLANGPLIGSAASSGDDAISHIQNLQSGSDKAVVDGVTFAGMKQMILDLTAGPTEMGHELPAEDAVHAPGAASSFQAEERQGDLASGADAGAPPSGLNFMQVSELEGQQAQLGNQQCHSVASEIPVHTHLTEVGSNAATPGGVSPVADKSASGWEAPNGLTSGSLPVSGSGWADEPVSGVVKNWADDVDESAPSNPFTATADIPSELASQQQTGGQIVDADGFIQDTRGRGRGRGGPRGRGGRGGRGDYRGGERREGGGGEWRPRPSGAEGGEGGQRPHRGGGRGGPGGAGPRRGSEHRSGEPRGEHRGRGRGGRGRGEAPAANAV